MQYRTWIKLGGHCAWGIGATLILGTACGGQTIDSGEMGMLGAALTGDGSMFGVEAIAYKLVSPSESCAAAPIAEETASDGTEVQFVLAAGRYRVCATPLDAEGAPSRVCRRAQQVTRVQAGEFREVRLISQCRSSGTGAAGISTEFNQAPKIEQLEISPERTFSRCGSATIDVTPSDADGDSVSVEFNVSAGSCGLDASGTTAIVSSDSVGACEVRITATDEYEGRTTLTVPLVVTDAECTRASFTRLGELPGGFSFSTALDTNADGSVVVGSSQSTQGAEGFRWTQATGLEALGDLPGGTFDGAIYATNSDGTILAGTGVSDSGFEAFRWSSGTLTPLGDLPGGDFESFVNSISDDGSTLVGGSVSENGYEAFLWRETSGMVPLGDLPEGTFESFAFDVSADGSVIVGEGASINGYEAFRWTSNSGMGPLGDLPGGDFSSRAESVNPDGSIIVGSGSSTNGLEAFRWTELAGMVPLGDLPGGAFQSQAYAVSADGQVIVGESSGSAPGTTAFVWQEAHGMRAVWQVLSAEGIDMSGWHLIRATSVSNDGRVIVGLGINPSGNNEAWRAELP